MTQSHPIQPLGRFSKDSEPVFSSYENSVPNGIGHTLPDLMPDGVVMRLNCSSTTTVSYVVRGHHTNCGIVGHSGHTVARTTSLHLGDSDRHVTSCFRWSRGTRCGPWSVHLGVEGSKGTEEGVPSGCVSVVYPSGSGGEYPGTVVLLQGTSRPLFRPKTPSPLCRSQNPFSSRRPCPPGPLAPSAKGLSLIKLRKRRTTLGARVG